jgi:hypothetical protein
MARHGNLPSRRLIVTETITWNGNAWELGVGFDPDGCAREVFVNGIKTGYALEIWAMHSCITVSHLLQSGWNAEDLVESLSPRPEEARSAMPSFIGVVVAHAVAVEKQCGAEMRATAQLARELAP